MTRQKRPLITIRITWYFLAMLHGFILASIFEWIINPGMQLSILASFIILLGIIVTFLVSMDQWITIKICRNPLRENTSLVDECALIILHHQYGRTDEYWRKRLLDAYSYCDREIVNARDMARSLLTELNLERKL